MHITRTEASGLTKIELRCDITGCEAEETLYVSDSPKPLPVQSEFEMWGVYAREDPDLDAVHLRALCPDHN